MTTKQDYALAYSKNFDRTVKLLISRGAPREAAEEAAQAAWTRGWERLGQLRNAQFLTTWINTIALNCYRRELRHERLWDALGELSGHEAMNLAALDLEKILSRCHESHRALLLQWLAGNSVQEIANAQGATNLAIRIRLSRARQGARVAAAKPALAAAA